MSTARRSRTSAEWVVFAIATAIILVLAGSIGWLWAQPSDPAHVTVETLGDPRVVDGQSYFSAELTNHGDETAEAVQVRAELIAGDAVVGEGEQIVDFLSGGQTEELVFVFADVPPGAQIELRVASFKVP
jgi:uncharacterized protein (TIGR02588 family)